VQSNTARIDYFKHQTVHGRTLMNMDGSQPTGLAYNRIIDALNRGFADRMFFVDFDDFYKTNRDKHDILIISDEIGKSKPATLFFLSKFGCQVEKVVFYSKITLDKIWEEFDVLLTANPDLLLNHPQDKKVIKFQTPYNQDIDFGNSIDNLKSLNEKILEIE
jgi:hypothetical protein